MYMLINVGLYPTRQNYTPFSITTRHTVSNAELFLSANCYTIFNDNTPHSEKR